MAVSKGALTRDAGCFCGLSAARRSLHARSGHRLRVVSGMAARSEFGFRCVYCLSREQWDWLPEEYDLDHFAPKKRPWLESSIL